MTSSAADDIAREALPAIEALERATTCDGLSPEFAAAECELRRLRWRARNGVWPQIMTVLLVAVLPSAMGMVEPGAAILVGLAIMAGVLLIDLALVLRRRTSTRVQAMRRIERAISRWLRLPAADEGAPS